MSNENCEGMKILKSTLDITVRFSETDPMGVVWHGNYLKYFEDAREKIAEDFGMSHYEVYDRGYFTPIIKTELNYKSSIFFGEKARVVVMLERHDAAKIIFKYEIINLTKGKLATTGMTTQIFMHVKDRTLELIKPGFYLQWEEKQNWIEE
jgi:acyl-CoA thioester hydrolase